MAVKAVTEKWPLPPACCAGDMSSDAPPCGQHSLLMPGVSDDRQQEWVLRSCCTIILHRDVLERDGKVAHLLQEQRSAQQAMAACGPQLPLLQQAWQGCSRNAQPVLKGIAQESARAQMPSTLSCACRLAAPPVMCHCHGGRWKQADVLARQGAWEGAVVP